MGMTKALSKKLDALFAVRAKLATTIKDAEASKSLVDAELLQLTTDAGGELATAEYKAIVVTTVRTALSEELLLKHGVKPTILAKSKVETPNRPYVKVTAVKVGV